MNSTILITGATGELGTLIINHLLKTINPSQITALVRDENKAAALVQKGVNIKVGDYFDTSSLLKAMDGIDKVLLISSNDFNDRIGQHKNVVDAAKQAGVKHIFYTGITMNEISQSPLKPLLEDHFQTEDYIKSSGLTYTFLQNSLYLEVIPMFIGANPIETGVYFAAGDGKVAFAAKNDLAEVIAKLLISENVENKAFTLSSSQAYSFNDVAETLSSLSGKKVDYISPSSEEFKVTLRQIGLPEPIVAMSTLFAAAIKNNDFENTNSTVEEMLGRPQINLTEFLKQTYQL